MSPQAPGHTITDLLGDTRARILEAVQRPSSQDGGITAAEIAAQLAITPAGVRRHLTALEADDLVISEAVAAGRMGRPSERWSLTPRGRRLFTDKSAEFADELLDHLEQTYGRGALADFLKARVEKQAERYAEDLASLDDPADRVHRLAEHLSADGFTAQVMPGASGRSLTLLQSHCAIEGIAREHPEICAHEAALFKRLLGTQVSRRETIAGGSTACVCHVTVADDTNPTTTSTAVSNPRST